MTKQNKITRETIRSIDDIYKRLYKACNLLKVLKELDANEDTFMMGHEEIIKSIDNSIDGIFNPLDDVVDAFGVVVDLSGPDKSRLVDTKGLGVDISLSGDESKEPASVIGELDQDLIDLALAIQSMGEDARNFAMASVEAIKRREAKGDDLSPQDDNELAFERGGAIMKDTPMIELQRKLNQTYSTVKMLKCFDMCSDLSGEGGPEADIDVSNMLCVISDLLKEAIAVSDEVAPNPQFQKEPSVQAH